MNGIYVINSFLDQYYDSSNKLYFLPDFLIENNFFININLNEQENIEPILKSKRLVNNALLEIKNDTLESKIYDYISNKEIKCNEVIVNSDSFERIKEIIEENNDFFKDKIIDIGIEVSFDKTGYKKIIDNFGYKDNYRFLVNGNEGYITLNEFKKSLEILDEINEKFNKYKLSNLEKIMYAYDIVRDKKYKFNEKNLTLSSDLSKVITGDTAICVGFSKFFKKILEDVNIPVKIIDIDSKNVEKFGHERTIIYVKDEKYNINGLFFFDPTWDSQTDKWDYINNYYFFMQNYKQIRQLDLFFNYETKFKIDEIMEYISKSDKKFYYLLKRKNQKEKTQIINKLFEQNIDPKSFFKLICNVRKIEYYEQDKYEFSLKQLLDTCNNFFTKKDIIERNVNIDVLEKTDIENSIEKENIDKEINQIKFTKSLKKYLSDKRM